MSHLELRHNQVVQVHPEVHVVPEVLRLLVHPSIEKLNVSLYKNFESQITIHIFIATILPKKIKGFVCLSVCLIVTHLQHQNFVPCYSVS